MKITQSQKRLMMWAAGALLAVGCAGDQQQQEDIVYSDQPQQEQQQQQGDYAQADDSAGGESSLDEADGSESEDLVSSYQEELSSDDTPVSSGIADSAAEASAESQEKWNSSTNDYNSGESTDSYASNNGAQAGSEPSLNYDTEPAYDTSADAGTTASTGYQGSTAGASAPKTWKKKSTSQWSKASTQSTYNAGYNDNLSTDLTGNQRLYIVQRGDTLSSIARKIYGDAALWNELAATNGISNANAIYPGDPIKFASNAYSKDFEATYDNIAKNTVTVQRGDTLSSISKQIFGDSGEWKVLYTMNKSEIADPNTIAPNQVLYYFTRESFNQAFMQSSIKERFGH